jgi:hypothetical protein
MYIIRYSCQVLMKPVYSRYVFEKKNAKISNFMKIRPVGANLFHADGRTHKQTHMAKVTVASQQFCERA